MIHAPLLHSFGMTPNYQTLRLPLSRAGNTLAFGRAAGAQPQGAASGEPLAWPPLGVGQPFESASGAKVSVHRFVSPAGYPLTVYTLSNGHRVMVEQRPSDYIGVRTFVNSGSVVEDAVKSSPFYANSGLPAGLAHLDEHLHLTSTQNYPQKNGMAEALNRLGSRSNASTSDERIQHELFFNREDATQALRLHAESLLRPLLNAEEINQEKKNVWNENSFRLGEVPYKLNDRFCDLMFDRPGKQTIGTLQTLRDTTPDDIRRFREQAYMPSHMLTVVTGNVDPQQVYNTLAPEFLSNPIPNRFGRDAALQLALKPNEVRVATVTDPRISTGMVHLGFPAPPSNNYQDRMAMEFLTQILSLGPLSVLGQSLVNQKGLASRVHSSYQPLKQTGVCKFMLDTPLGKEREAASEVLNQLAKVAQGGISDEQVAKTRQVLVQNFRSRLESTEDATHWIGSEALGQTLPYALHYEQIANLVTAQDLQEVARRYLNPSRYALVYGLPGIPQTPAGGSV
jgi:zinc protease